MRRPSWSWRGVAVSSILLTLSFVTGCGAGSKISPAGTSNPPASSPPGFSGYAPPGTFGVIAINPAPGATNVTSHTVQITFSSVLDLTTVSPSNIRITAPDSSQVSGSLSSSASSATVTFAIALNPTLKSGTYTVTVSGVKSAAGAAMAGTFTSTFSTPAPPTFPTVNVPCGPYSGTDQFRTEPPCDQYWTLLHPTIPSAPQNDFTGSILMDTNGSMTISFGALVSPIPANSELTVQFCPAYNSNYTAKVPACFDVGVVSSNSAGNVSNATLAFPRSGAWAGDFQVLEGDTVILQTTYPAGDQPVGNLNKAPHLDLMQTMQPETTVNGTGITNGKQVQDPLSIGQLGHAIQNNVVWYLNGAAPNSTYVTTETVSLDLATGGSQISTPFTTDGSGNFTLVSNGFGSSAPGPYLSVNGGDIFTIEPQDKTHAGWIGGFSVP